MQEELRKFVRDMLEAGVAAAVVAVAALDLNVANPKAMLVVVSIAFINGVISAARRKLNP